MISYDLSQLKFAAIGCYGSEIYETMKGSRDATGMGETKMHKEFWWVNFMENDHL